MHHDVCTDSTGKVVSTNTIVQKNRQARKGGYANNIRRGVQSWHDANEFF
jgi:hypothetical protein